MWSLPNLSSIASTREMATIDSLRTRRRRCCGSQHRVSSGDGHCGLGICEIPTTWLRCSPMASASVDLRVRAYAGPAAAARHHYFDRRCACLCQRACQLVQGRQSRLLLPARPIRNGFWTAAGALGGREKYHAHQHQNNANRQRRQGSLQRLSAHQSGKDQSQAAKKEQEAEGER